MSPGEAPASGTLTPASLDPPMSRWKLAMGSSVSLVTITVVASTLLRLASSLILTRLLSPEDFGAAAITAAILGVMLMISDLGFEVFVIQHRNGDDPRFLDVVWTIRLLRSVVLTLLLLLLAGPLATLIGKPALTAAIAVTSLHFIIEGLSSLTLMTVVRQQKLFRLSCVDVSTTALQIVFGIILAMVFRSYWALIVSGLLAAAVKSVLSYAAFDDSRRRLRFDRDYFAEMWTFGRTIVSAQAIQVLLSQVDKFVLSRLFSLNLFGIYSIASNLAGAPAAFTTAYPTRVLLPAFAKAHRDDPGSLRTVYYDSRRTIMLLYMAAMGGFIGVAPAIIDILYDPRYATAGQYLRFLAIAPLIGLNNYAAREVLIVIGKVKPLLIGNFVRLAWLAGAGIAAYLGWGPIGLVVAVGTIEVPVLCYNWWELRRNALLRMDQELIMLGTAVAGAAAGWIGNTLFAVGLG